MSNIRFCSVALQVEVKMLESYKDSGLNTVFLEKTTNLNFIVLTGLEFASQYEVTVEAVDITSKKTIRTFNGKYWTLQGGLPLPKAPKIINVSDTTMYIRLFEVKYKSELIDHHSIVVEEDKDDPGGIEVNSTLNYDLMRSAAEFVGFKMAKLKKLNYYVTLQLPPAHLVPWKRVEYLIGDNTEVINIWNTPLIPNHKYVVWHCIFSELDGGKDHACAMSEQYAIPSDGVYTVGQPRTTQVNIPLIIALVLFGIWLISMIVACCFWYHCLRHKRGQEQEEAYGQQQQRGHRGFLSNIPRLFHFRLADRFGGSRYPYRGFPFGGKRKGRGFFTSTPMRRGIAGPLMYSEDERFFSRNECDDNNRKRSKDHQTSRTKVKGSHYLPSDPICCMDLANLYEKKPVDDLIDEFKCLPCGATEQVTVPMNPENHSRNRSVKALAYDFNRVKLNMNNPLENDYINASHVMTHNDIPLCYIVTQAPLKNTISHFWRMVWEQNVDTVVMLMDTSELKHPDREQYWPCQVGECEVYEAIKVCLLEYTALAHYSIRQLLLSQFVSSDSKEKRRVIHYQYRSWTCASVPHHPVPVLDFVYRIQCTHNETNGIVVHCNLGTGRSGMFIAIDTLLQEGKNTDKVDIIKCVHGLRLERANLVHTTKQYKFIYTTLIEAFHYKDTRIKGTNFDFVYKNMLSVGSEGFKSMICMEFDELSKSERKDGKPKNKFMKWTHHPSYSSPGMRNDISTNQTMLENTKSGDELLFSKMDSHCIRDNFIVMLYPNKSGKVTQLWDMVYELRCLAVIMINDTESYHEPYWPQEGTAIKEGDCCVKTLCCISDPSKTFCICDIEVRKGTSKSAPKVQCRHFQFVSWPQRQHTPSISHMLCFLQHIRMWHHKQQQELYACGESGGPIVVHSANGMSRSSLFCMLWTVIERIDEEGVVDIYRTARYVRSSLNSAVTNYVCSLNTITFYSPFKIFDFIQN